MRAIIRPSTLTLLFGPAAWAPKAFHDALAEARPGFTPLLDAAEPHAPLTWSGVDLAIVPATQVLEILGPDQVLGTPQTTVAADSVTQTFPAVSASPQAMYDTRIAAGVSITSTGTTALSGAYAIDAGAQANINAEVTSILLNGTFTNGQTARVWPGKDGHIHSFDLAHFKEFATKAALHVDALILTRETLEAGEYLHDRLKPSEGDDPMKKLLLLACLLPVAALAQEPPAACPAACTVTLPGASWDRLGAALQDAIAVRQDLFSELARQMREQMPKPPSLVQGGPPGDPNAPAKAN